VKWGSSGAHSVAKEDGWYVALDVIASLVFFFEISLRIVASPKVRLYNAFFLQTLKY
jgi:hypothetical protein